MKITAAKERNQPTAKKCIKRLRQVRAKSMIKTNVCLIVLILLLVPIPVLSQTTAGEQSKPKPTPKTTTLKKTPPKNNNKPKVCTAKSPTKATGRTHTASLPNGVSLEFVELPSGSFCMGSPTTEKYRGTDESPRRRVTINYRFYMGKFEVTQAQWCEVTGSNPSRFSGCDDCPVENVSWNDAKEFIKKLNALNDGFTYRLPSEAEWEYACRAGTTTVFSFGDSLGSTQANFDGNFPYGTASNGKYLAKTTMVGSYQPNGFGLYDMHGNVWEWCEDIYADSYEGLPTDGSANVSKGDSSSRVLRGGSWVSYGLSLCSASRFRHSAGNRSNYYGFRVVAVSRT